MMTQYLQVFMAGLFISLSGSLPLGNLNVAAMQIAARETVVRALWFATGVTIVEMVYLQLTLTFIGGLHFHDQLFFAFRIISVVLLAIMATGSFIAVSNKEGKNILLDNKARRLILGATMSAVNPMQIPFWTGWIVYLLSQSLLPDTRAGHTILTISAGIGTFVALLIFIFAGRKFSAVMLRNKKTVNIIMGFLFLSMAAFQFVTLFR